MSNKTTSLFDRIGGMDAVSASVDIFYAKVTSDPAISHFFKSIDMETQSQKLKTFLAYAFGAPLNYQGKNMQDAHAHMKINESHFNAVAKHLADTLEELSVEEVLIDEVMTIAASTKSDIVNS